VTVADLWVSVVVPVKNGADLLGEALESALGQTCPPGEVIVVDDGSTDESDAIARRFPVRVVQSDGAGVSAARNTGIAASRGDVIAFLDHDDLWEPRKLERQRACLAEDPEVSYVSCGVTLVVEPGAPPPRRAQEEHFAGRAYSWVIPSALAARRESFEVIGVFNTELAIGEDLDWMFRARDAGLKAAIVKEPLVRYRVHGRNTTALHRADSHQILHMVRTSLARRRAAAGGSAHGG
jgi:glycosyltransferase involved in cell wall biosynthesis